MWNASLLYIEWMSCGISLGMVLGGRTDDNLQVLTSAEFLWLLSYGLLLGGGGGGTEAVSPSVCKDGEPGNDTKEKEVKVLLRFFIKVMLATSTPIRASYTLL